MHWTIIWSFLNAQLANFDAFNDFINRGIIRYFFHQKFADSLFPTINSKHGLGDLDEQRQHTPPLFFFPLIISRINTPKLYISNFIAKIPSNSYSGEMYPLKETTQKQILCTNENVCCLQCTNNFSCIKVGFIITKNSSHSKVRNFRVHIFVKKDVACFEISVNNSKS